jgi:hypothetical protein
LKLFNINPGIGQTFPWLAQVASNYEEYSFSGLIFEFRSTSSNALNSTNTALGTVILATQYNALSAPFVNKQQMENYEFAASGNPSCNIMHAVECEKFLNPLSTLFVRELDAATIANSDKRLFDLGNFSIASVGLQGTSVNMGELWVSYDITFSKPKLSEGSDVADHFVLNAPSITTGSWLGNVTLAALSTTSDFGVTLTQTTIVIPPYFSGNVVIHLSMLTASASQTAPTFTGSLGATPLNILFTNAINAYVTPNSQIVDIIQCVSYWTIASGGTITISGGSTGAAGTVSVADLIVMAISSNLLN